MPAIAILHRDTILQRLAAGEYQQAIASDLGVSPQAISNQLASDPDYQAAISASLDARLDQREIELEQATDGLGVARARELLSHARWRAERLNPARYGQRPTTAVQINMGAQGMSDDDLRRIAAPLLRADPQPPHLTDESDENE